jgi:hypothetical protein
MSGGFDWCGLRGSTNDEGWLHLRDATGWSVVTISPTAPHSMSYPIGKDGLYDADGPDRAFDLCQYASTDDALDALTTRVRQAAKARTQRAR